MKHGVLPVRLSRADCDTLRIQLHELPGAEIALDLEAQTVTGPDSKIYSFEIGPFNKHKMLNGLDEITLTLSHDADISAFEERHQKSYDWL
jgi:3-isopropylmalate/(R)-2-methylmalate dehydratase small subunit